MSEDNHQEKNQEKKLPRLSAAEVLDMVRLVFSNSSVDKGIAPAQGILLKGAIMADVGGQLVVANAPTDKLFGILLDDVDTGETGAVEVKVAQFDRKGAFNATQLYCGSGTTIATLEEGLRDIGIFLEGIVASPAEEKKKGLGRRFNGVLLRDREPDTSSKALE